MHEKSGALRVSVGPWAWGALPPGPPKEKAHRPTRKLSTKPGQPQSARRREASCPTTEIRRTRLPAAGLAVGC